MLVPEIMTLLLILVLSEKIDHFDNTEDEYCSYSNISVNGDIKQSIPLYDTSHNFLEENLENKTYSFQICFAKDLKSIDHCLKNKTIITNETDPDQLELIIIQAKKKNNQNVFLIASDLQKPVEVSHDDRFTKLVFQSNDTEFFNKFDNNKIFTLNHYFGVQCLVVQAPLLHYTIAMCLWTFMIFVWILTLQKWYKRQSLCIHKILLYLMVMKCAVDFISLIKMLSCSEFMNFQFIMLAKSSLSTIFYSFLSAFFFAISLGINIFYDIFTRKQFIYIVAITFSSYMVNSLHYIFGSTSFYVMQASRVAQILFASVVGGFIVTLSLKYAFSFRRAILELDQPEMREIIKGMRRKYRMMITYALIISLYEALVIYQNILFLVSLPTDRTRYLWDGIEANAFLIVFIAISIIFHPCFFDAPFRLGVIEHIEFLKQHRRTLAPFLACKIQVKKSTLPRKCQQMIVLNPESANLEVLNNLCIATEISKQIPENSNLEVLNNICIATEISKQFLTII